MFSGSLQPLADSIFVQAHDAACGPNTVAFYQTSDGAVERLLVSLKVEQRVMRRAEKGLRQTLQRNIWVRFLPYLPAAMI